MKILFIIDDSGMDIYTDPQCSIGRITGPIFATYQSILQQTLGQSFRSLTIRGEHSNMNMASQVYGRITIALISDEGDSISRLDSEIALIRDIVLTVFDPKCVEGEKEFSFRSTSSKMKQLGRFCETALDLAMVQPSVLLRAYEKLEINKIIRQDICEKLQKSVSHIRDIHGAVLFGGTRVIDQYIPPSKSGSSQLTSKDILLIMLFVQSNFRLTRNRSKKPQPSATSESSASGGAAEAAASSASREMSQSDITSSEIKQDEDDDEEEDEEELPLASPEPSVISVSDISETSAIEEGCTTPKQNEDSTDGKQTLQSESSSTGSQPANKTLESVQKAQQRVSLLTPAKEGKLPDVGALFPSSSPDQPVAIGRVNVTKSESLPSTPLSKQSKPARAFPSYSLVKKVGNSQIISCLKKEGKPRGLGVDWIPAEFNSFARVAILHLSDGKQYYVYVAELLDDIFYALVLSASRVTAEEVEKQRNDVLISHLYLSQYLETDYAAFLQAKMQSHMPVLNFAHDIPGLVHFLFVDRVKGIAVVPSISTLYDSDFGKKGAEGEEDESRVAAQRHTDSQIRQLVFELIHHAFDHLAMGCTHMMVRSRGFTMNYLIWFEEEGEAIPIKSLDQLLVGTKYESLPHPWVISPELYNAIVQNSHYSGCLELYSIYVGNIPASAVSAKDYELRQQIYTFLKTNKP